MEQITKNLAIKGHETRGKEVIEIMEMLGGKNVACFSGKDIYCVYYIDVDKYICRDIYRYAHVKYYIITLEEFLEKFPYKVGDNVHIPEYESEVRICEMRWDMVCKDVKYLVYRYGNEEWYSASELLDNNADFLIDKEESMEVDVNDNKTLLNMSAIDYNNGLVGYEIPAGYKFDTVIDNKVVLKKLKPLFPKTYKDCCEVLMGKTDFQDYSLVLTKLSTNKNEENSISPEPPHITLINNFYKLLICRDAYLKIAGEQMGLGKPWEPDWNNGLNKCCISSCEDKIIRCAIASANNIIAFPTEEMRDVFYENFKDLIESCKEFL